MGKSSQIETGMRAVLALPWVYRTAMSLLRNRRHNEWFLNDVVAPKEEDTFIDIGCGPADILEHLPRVRYVGLDISDAYVAAARERWNGRGTFVSGSVFTWRNDARLREADIVLINGVLHHTDDAVATELLKFGVDALKAGGRLVCYEPVYLRWQSAFGRKMMARDRGQHIRSESEWKTLVSGPLPGCITSVTANINRLGYTGIIVEYRKPAD
jgi:SAM-dependent methyltransferase